MLVVGLIMREVDKQKKIKQNEKTEESVPNERKDKTPEKPQLKQMNNLCNEEFMQ